MKEHKIDGEVSLALDDNYTCGKSRLCLVTDETDHCRCCFLPTRPLNYTYYNFCAIHIHQFFSDDESCDEVFCESQVPILLER